MHFVSKLNIDLFSILQTCILFRGWFHAFQRL